MLRQIEWPTTFFGGKFVPALEPLKKSSFNVPTNQMSIFVFFVSAGPKF